MPYFDNLARESGGLFPETSMSIALIDSVMAFGYQAYLTVSQRFISSEERKKADFYSIIALRSRGSVLCSPNTLLKLQTTVSEKINETIHCELLAGAVSCARALKLENRDFPHGENTSSKDRDLASRSLWYLYSIEVPHSLRRGVSPVLDYDWIDHAPPEAGKETDWFSVLRLYAIIISSVAGMLYNQRALRQTPAEREHKLKTAYELLEGWRSHLPAPLQGIHKQDIHLILDDHRTRDLHLSIFRQYHEAIFMIYFPWTGSQADGRISEDYRRKSMELCVNSAQVVFLNLIAASICIIFLDVATRSSAKNSISYLSMGCGIFGRLNILDNEVPLADLLELTRTAQQMKRT
uniref:Putative C6 transcription factor n=1 Tax=Cladonia uncialis subsp. uncialis TaxID=180999 RepID=A0A1Z1C479_CLAUC|nr:putative C6 transcription factor [Cladonia uncialis subsp. uncialis]AUW31185.1 putative C6 transcription factor [Cladonia uncialis subsp. uncialis]